MSQPHKEKVVGLLPPPPKLREGCNGHPWERAFLGTQAASPARKQAGGVSIINLASIAGLVGSTLRASYNYYRLTPPLKAKWSPRLIPDGKHAISTLQCSWSALLYRACLRKGTETYRSQVR